MRFSGFVLGWLLGLLTGLLSGFVLFVFLDALLNWEPGPAPIIGWTGWLRLLCVALMFLALFTMDWGESPSRDVAVQTTPIVTGVDSSAQTDETPLGVVLSDVINDTLLPGIAGLLDARLRSLPPGDGEEGEEDDDGSRVHAALHWLANLGPDPSGDDDDNDDGEGHAPGLTNGHHSSQ